jgi:hypothetical protein
MPFQKGHKFYKGGEKAWFKKNHKIRVGMKHKPETIEKISKAKIGSPAYWKGKKIPKEARENMSKARIGRFAGENSPSWKGGITSLNMKIRTSLEYKLWRTAVFERDNYTCIWCGAKSQKEKAVILHADHIKPFAHYPELRFAIDNGRTLCIDCHKKTSTYGNSSKLFQKAILSLLIVIGFLFTNPFEVRADTFGYTTAGSSYTTNGINRVLSGKATPSLSGTVTKISFSGKSDSAFQNTKAKALIFQDSDFEIISNGVANEIDVDSTTKQWWDLTFSTNPSIIGEIAYWVGLLGYTSGPAFYVQPVIYYDTRSDSVLRMAYDGGLNNYSSPTSPINDYQKYDEELSIYATYTPSGETAAVEDPYEGVIIFD